MARTLKSKAIKKKTKKKASASSSNLCPLVKPDKFDGVSNWAKMQEVLGLVSYKKEEFPKDLNHEMKVKSQDSPSPSYRAGVQLSEFFPSSLTPEKMQNHSNHCSARYSDVVKNVKSPIMVNSDKKNDSSTKSSYVHEDRWQPWSSFGVETSNWVNYSTVAKPKSVNKEKKAETTQRDSSETMEKKLTKAVSMDCEMVGTGPTGEDSIIARVSIVNAYGDCLYDEFVKPKERVTDYRTAISGVRPSDLKKGKDLLEVQKDVFNIIDGRILVGHSIKHDLDVLFLSHPKHLIRDTAYYRPFRDLCGGRTPSLKKLTLKLLGCDIQCGEHSSVEDAQAAMLLYLRHKKEWENEIRFRRRKKHQN